MIQLIKYFLFIISLLYFTNDLYATHAAGMDISYECISRGNSQDTYKVTVKFYRDCDGLTAPNRLRLFYTSSCGSYTKWLNRVGGITNINPQCPTTCNGGNSVGIEEYIYQTNITINHCSDWIFSVCENARQGTINTIVFPGGQDLCIQATLNNLTNCNTIYYKKFYQN